MIERNRILTAIGAAAAIVTGSFGLPSPAAAQSGGPFEYAVKFVCGLNAATSAATAPGSYFTAINIHNPDEEATPFVHKVAPAGRGRPAGHTPLVSPFRIPPDEAVDVDCQQIARELAAGGLPSPGPFFTGFFVIQSRIELDVVAVYTAAPPVRGGAVVSIHTERVPVRRR